MPAPLAAQPADAVSGASVPGYAAGGEPEVFESEGMRLRVEEVVRRDDVIWAMDFIDASTMLFTERSGQLNLLRLDDIVVTPVVGGPTVHVSASGGLFDVMVDPAFADNGWLYLTYVKPLGDRAATALARGRLRGATLTDLTELFVANNASAEFAHWGSRVIMDADRYLYVTIGDRHVPDDAQDLASHGGKVVRLHEDGRVPADNPFVGRDDAAPEVWTYGHRNPQGLTLQPGSGAVVEQEHGPTGGDEVNILVAGRNYGWPVISHGQNIWGGRQPEGTARAGMEQPLKYWVPGIAPAGMTFYTGPRYPAWQGNLFNATLRGQLVRLVLDASAVVGEEALLPGAVDRIRDVAEGPDGYLYFATESGRIARIVPAGP